MLYVLFSDLKFLCSYFYAVVLRTRACNHLLTGIGYLQLRCTHYTLTLRSLYAPSSAYVNYP